MKIRLIASTLFDIDAIYDVMKWGEEHIEQPDSGDMLAEFAGRTCYLSYDRPNPKTFKTADYLGNILKQGHESVLEHSSASFYVTGVSRNLLIELERHRFLSFSVVSTRYVDASRLELITPPALDGGLESDPGVFDTYRGVVEYLRGHGSTEKQAREAAAFYLPGGLETRFVVTGNFRAWRDVIRKRNHKAANAEIRQFAKVVLDKLKFIAPSSFQDLQVNPDE